VVPLARLREGRQQPAPALVCPRRASPRVVIWTVPAPVAAGQDPRRGDAPAPVAAAAG
jgi:hypothetical protein